MLSVSVIMLLLRSSRSISMRLVWTMPRIVFHRLIILSLFGKKVDLETGKVENLDTAAETAAEPAAEKKE